MSNHEFLSEIQMSGNFSEAFLDCCRMELGNIFRLDPYKIYPTDKWRDLYHFAYRDWDILEIVDSLENNLGIEIMEEQVPWQKSMTIGLWISSFIINCLP